MPVLSYDLTLSMRGYTPQSNAWSAEAHYTIALTGSIHQNRERLRDFAIPHFQEVMRRHYGMYIPRGDVRGQFQPEQPALSPSPALHVEVFETVYRGRQHYNRGVTSEDLPYSSDENGEEGYDLPRNDQAGDHGEDEESNDDGYDDSDEDDSDEDEDESDD